MTTRRYLNQYREESASHTLKSSHIEGDTDEDDDDSYPEINTNLSPSANSTIRFQEVLDIFKKISKTDKCESVALKTASGALCGTLFIVLCILCHNHFITTGGSPKNQNLWKRIYSHLSSKSSHFPSQSSDLWSRITVGLQNLDDEPMKPAVYLLMFGEDAITSSSCIVELITLTANKFALNGNRWLLVNGTVLSKSNSRDPGILIDTLSKEMEYSKIVIITDVQKIPAKLAQGFHFLVDEYNPKIPNAVYIFTMMVPSGNKFSAEEIAEDVLTNSWKDLDDDSRNALITRVTNVVLPILKEEIIEACPLKISSTIEISIP